MLSVRCLQNPTEEIKIACVIAFPCQLSIYGFSFNLSPPLRLHPGLHLSSAFGPEFQYLMPAQTVQKSVQGHTCLRPQQQWAETGGS